MLNHLIIGRLQPNILQDLGDIVAQVNIVISIIEIIVLLVLTLNDLRLKAILEEVNSQYIRLDAAVYYGNLASLSLLIV